MPTLLSLHAHPDDESSKAAATVARYSRAGVHCVLVTATGGEAGDILNPLMDRPEVIENLAAYRHDELVAAAAVLGYDEVVELGYRDSGMPGSDDNAREDAFANVDYDEVLGRLVTLVRRVRPDVMLGYDAHERYPHPDHLRVHRLGLDVFTAAADAECFPGAGEPFQIRRLFAPVFSIRRVRSLHDAAIDRGFESPFSRWIDDIPLEAVDDGEMVSVEVAATLETGREALRAHRTQVDPSGFWFSLPTEVVADVYPYEDFELLDSVGEFDGSAGDLFEGL